MASRVRALEDLKGSHGWHPQMVELLPLREGLDCFLLEIQFLLENLKAHTFGEGFKVIVCGLLILQLLQLYIYLSPSLEGQMNVF